MSTAVFLLGLATGVTVTVTAVRLGPRLNRLDLSMVRLVPPPRGAGRWQVWATSRYADRTERLVGRYRTHWAASRVAAYLNAGPSGALCTFDARRATQRSEGAPVGRP